MRRYVLLTLALLLAVSAPAEAQGSREVVAGLRSIVPITAKVRFTTMIVLPDGEEILDFVCGDKDFWVISGAHNLAYVKPAKPGAATNLNLVTASGNVYSFVLSEGGGEPDLKVYVVPDESLAPALAAPARYYSAAEVDELRGTIEDLRGQAQEAREAAARVVGEAAAAKLAADRSVEEEIAAYRSRYPSSLQFPYRFDTDEKPFHVSAIFHDDRFTYIRAESSELPALYEVRDGQPNLIAFQVEDGLYIVPKIVDRGYLAIGKKKLTFEMER